SPPFWARAARLRSSRWAGMRPSASLAARDDAEPAADSDPLADDSAGWDAAAFSRAAWARLRWCSGISVIDVSSRSQRTGDASVLADPPEVDRHEDDDHEREEQDVEHVPAQQRLRADLGAAQQHEPDLRPEDQGVAHHVRAHGDR